MIIGGHYKCVYQYSDFEKFIKHIKNAGGNAIQIFVGDNISTTLTTKARFTNEEFKKAKEITKGMKKYIHASLTLNYCNPLIKKYQWGLDNLIYDMNFGAKMDVIGCVLHMGVIFKDRYLLKNFTKEAFENMKKSIEYVLERTPKKIKIILETSAGQKNKIGTLIEDFAKIYKMISPKYRSRVKICIDTCHIFVAGYPIHTPAGIKSYFQQFKKQIGMKHVELIHLNDTKAEFDSHLDRHYNLLLGNIFTKETLKLLLTEIKNKPMILETRKLDYYRKEIKLVKQLST